MLRALGIDQNSADQKAKQNEEQVDAVTPLRKRRDGDEDLESGSEK